MRRWLAHRFYILVFAVSAPALLQAQQLSRYNACFNGELKRWAQSFRQFKLSGFKRTGAVVQFDAINPARFKSIKEFYPDYKAAISCSGDGKYCINIYDYLLLEKKNGRFYTPGEDVEQSILLGNIPQRQWLRIAYYGYARRAQEVCWVDNNTFILATVLTNKTGKGVPEIMIGHIRQKTFEVFTAGNPGCYQKKAGYHAAKLSRLAITKT